MDGYEAQFFVLAASARRCVAQTLCAVRAVLCTRIVLPARVGAFITRKRPAPLRIFAPAEMPDTVSPCFRAAKSRPQIIAPHSAERRSVPLILLPRAVASVPCP